MFATDNRSTLSCLKGSFQPLTLPEFFYDVYFLA
jgi:hypothetical protein